MKLDYRPDIDGLRAVAVTSVIVYHANINISSYRLLEGGFLGVDIFFVISGYLITSLILKEIKLTNTFSFLYFYERRIRRILPVLCFVITSCLPFAWFFLFPTELLNFVKSLISSLSFFSNIFFYSSGQDYLAKNSLFIPLLHTWSLSIEEQFYMIFPIFIFIITSLYKKKLLLSLVFLFLLSLFISHIGAYNFSILNFYSIHSRLWELLAGSILAYLYINTDFLKKKFIFKKFLPLIGLVLILIGIIYFDNEIKHPSLFTLVPIFGTVLIIAFPFKDNFVNKILSSKIFVYIGLISYSLYLWHYPIFSFARIGFTGFDTDGFFKELIIITLLISLSIFSYFFIEKPFRKKIINFKHVIIPIFIFYIILLTFGVLVLKNNGFEKRFFSSEKYSLSRKPYLEDYTNYIQKYNFGNYPNDKTSVLIVGNSFAINILQILNDSKFNKDFYFSIPGPNKRKMNNNYQIKYFLDYLKNGNIFIDGQFEDFSHDINTQYANSQIIILATLWSPDDIELIAEINSIVNKDGKKLILFDQSPCGKTFLSYELNRLDHFVFTNNRLPNQNEIILLEKDFFNDYGVKTCFSNKVDETNLKIEKIARMNEIQLVKLKNLYCNEEEKKCPFFTRRSQKIYFDYGHITRYGSKFLSERVNFLNIF